MLQPRKVGIARWRGAILPTGITAQLFTTPVTDIERRIGDDEIRFDIFVGIVQKGYVIVNCGILILS